MRRGNFAALFALFALFLMAASLVSLGMGAMDLSPAEIFDALFSKNAPPEAEAAVWQIRLPRLAAGIVAGSSLAVAGCAMQTLFMNPLADPSVTGVSSGAALGGALSVCAFSLGGIYIQIFAAAFGFLAAFFIWRAGRLAAGQNTYAMLLAGIAVNAFCAAMIGFFMYASKEEGLRGFLFWSLGSLEIAGWGAIGFAALLEAAALAVLARYSKALNLLFLGEEGAFYSGANLELLRTLAMACAALLTASAVSICGIVGFVGLVVPHIIRRFSGADNRVLMPLSALGGAALITVCDIFSRAVCPEQNIPIGIMAALVGAPFFLALVVSKTRITL
ncbi:MAG: iron ABC transporter permease [Opitutales bacterium]|nr:iron ABC transporter permease [Opitutales bacterium]